MNGKRLKEIRENNNISREELAQKICSTEFFIRSWEENWYIEKPSSGEIEEMANAFNMTEDLLRSQIDMPEDEDSDKNEIKFIDYIDAGIRAVKYIREEKN